MLPKNPTKEFDLDAKAKKNETDFCLAIDKETQELNNIYNLSTSNNKAHHKTSVFDIFKSNSEIITKETQAAADRMTELNKPFSTLFYAVLAQSELFDPDMLISKLNQLNYLAKHLYNLFTTPREYSPDTTIKPALYYIEPKAITSMETIMSITNAYCDSIKKKFPSASVAEAETKEEQKTGMNKSR